MKHRKLFTNSRESILLLFAGLLLCLLLALMICLRARPIHAYLEDTKEVVNTVTIGSNEITVEEEFEEPEKGEKTVKQPTAKNTGRVDCYVRGKVVVSDSRALEYLEYYYNDAEGINTADWIVSDDGWMYYDSILKIGENTTPIFSHIKLSDSIPDSFLGFTIDVLFESVQSEHFSNAGKAFEALKEGGGEV